MCFTSGTDVCFFNFGLLGSHRCLFGLGLLVGFILLGSVPRRGTIVSSIRFEVLLRNSIRFLIRFGVTKNGRGLSLRVELLVLGKFFLFKVFLRTVVFCFLLPVTAAFDDFAKDATTGAQVVWVDLITNDFVAHLFFEASATYSVLEIFFCSHSTRLLDQL